MWQFCERLRVVVSSSHSLAAPSPSSPVGLYRSDLTPNYPFQVFNNREIMWSAKHPQIITKEKRFLRFVFFWVIHIGSFPVLPWSSRLHFLPRPCLMTSHASPVSPSPSSAHLHIQSFSWWPFPLVLPRSSDSSTFPSRKFYQHLHFLSIFPFSYFAPQSSWLRSWTSLCALLLDHVHLLVISWHFCCLPVWRTKHQTLTQIIWLFICFSLKINTGLVAKLWFHSDVLTASPPC